jgi:xylulokinase
MRQVSSLVEAPFGDAFLAGLGVGLIDKPERIKDWVKFRDPISPDPNHREIYEKQYSLFRELYEKTKETMWKMV